MSKLPTIKRGKIGTKVVIPMYCNYNDAIVLAIRSMRIHHNISQKDMLAGMCLSSSGYSKLESGEVKITVVAMKQIATILNLSAFDILQFGEEIYAYSNSCNTRT